MSGDPAFTRCCLAGSGRSRWARLITRTCRSRSWWRCWRRNGRWPAIRCTRSRVACRTTAPAVLQLPGIRASAAARRDRGGGGGPAPGPDGAVDGRGRPGRAPRVGDGGGRHVRCGHRPRCSPSGWRGCWRRWLLIRGAGWARWRCWTGPSGRSWWGGMTPRAGARPDAAGAGGGAGGAGAGCGGGGVRDRWCRTGGGARAGRLAGVLAGRGGPESVVAVCWGGRWSWWRRCWRCGAGAAYLPLDPGYPAGRIAFMLADSGARRWSWRRGMLAAAWPGWTVPVLRSRTCRGGGRGGVCPCRCGASGVCDLHVGVDGDAQGGGGHSCGGGEPGGGEGTVWRRGRGAGAAVRSLGV